MRAAAQGRGKARVQERAVRDTRLDQIVEPVVKKNLRVIDHDQVHANEHLEHALVEIEVDRPWRLGVSAGPVEHRPVPLAPNRQLHLERAGPQAVVVHVILKRLRLSRDVALDERFHRPIRTIEQRLAGGEVGVAAETLTQLQHPLLGGLAAGDDAH